MDTPTKLKDPLQHLPCCPTILQYDPGQVIYSPHDPAANVYLIIHGSVKLTEPSRDGRQVLLDIYRPEEFFGEAALLNIPVRLNQATTMDETTLMVWGIQEFQDLLLTRPALDFALLQLFVYRLNGLERRVTSLAHDSVIRRLLRALVRLGNRLGTVDQKGNTHLLPLSHLLIAQHIGTSREIVTHYMTQFRDRGLLTYSRREIVILGDGLKRLLESEFGEIEDRSIFAPPPGTADESSLRNMLSRSATGALPGGVLPPSAKGNRKPVGIDS